MSREEALGDIVACATALDILSRAVDDAIAQLAGGALWPTERIALARDRLEAARAAALAIVDAPPEAPNPRDPAGDPPVERPILSLEADQTGTLNT